MIETDEYCMDVLNQLRRSLSLLRAQAIDPGSRGALATFADVIGDCFGAG
jgi:hypothetical protein